MNEGEKVAKMGWGKIEGAKCVGGQKKSRVVRRGRGSLIKGRSDGFI